MFNTTNFPGASSAQLDAARATYAILTGRVASVTSQAVLDGDTGQYVSRAEYARGRHQDLRRVRAGHLADQTESDVDGRYPLRRQAPFAPTSSVMSSVTMDSICGRSGVGDGGDYSRCNFLAPGCPRRFRAAVHPAREGLAGLQDGLEQHRALSEYRLAAERGFRVPARAPGRSRSGHAARRIFRSLRSAGTLAVHRSLWRQPRRVDLADAKRQHRAGAAWRIVAGSALADRPTHASALQPRSDLSDRRRVNRADNINAFAPDIQIARVRTWTVGFARSVSRNTAVEIRYIGNRGDNEWSAINYNCGTINGNTCTGYRGENLVANGFMNEFKLAMGNLAANNASGAASRAGSFAYFGSGTGTSPLPIYLAYLNGRPTLATPPPISTPHDMGELDDRRPPGGAEPEPERGRRSISTAT